MKKIIAILMSLVLMVGVLTACNAGKDDDVNKGNKTENNNNQGNSNNGEYKSWDEIKAQIPESLKGTTVTIYSWNEKNAVQGATMAIQKFEEETGIHVKWITAGYNEYATKLAAMVTSDEAPDIVRLRDANPAIVKLLQPLENVNYDFTDGAWDQELMSHYSFNGKHYAAVLKDSPFYQPVITYYNRALIEKFNLEDPYELWKNGEWTWTKMEEIIDTFLEAAGDQYNGLSMTCGCDYAYSLGTSMISYNPDANAFESHVDEVDFLKGWQYTVNNMSRGRVAKQTYAYESFAAGTILFYNDSAIDARTGHWYFADMMDRGTLGTVPMPAIEGQEEYYAALSENEAYGIPKASKNAEAAAYFLRFYLDSANYDMDTFYCDEQAYEVVEWYRDKTYVTDMQESINGATAGIWCSQIHGKLRDTGVAQMQTVLDTYEPVLGTMEQFCNDMIEELE